MSYFDYRFKFPLAGLAEALAALVALRAANIIVGGNLPENMLGDPRDASGNIAVDSSQAAFIGRSGRAAMTLTNDDGSTTIVPAVGDPNYWYVAIRSQTAPGQILVNPASYGLQPCSAEESAEVLGAWA